MAGVAARGGHAGDGVIHAGLPGRRRLCPGAEVFGAGVPGQEPFQRLAGERFPAVNQPAASPAPRPVPRLARELPPAPPAAARSPQAPPPPAPTANGSPPAPPPASSTAVPPHPGPRQPQPPRPHSKPPSAAANHAPRADVSPHTPTWRQAAPPGHEDENRSRMQATSRAAG
jgi:hypothetical protein